MRPAQRVPIPDVEATQPYAMPPRPAAHYGTQRAASFEAGTAKAVQLAECRPTALLWRVTASGENCTFTLQWGSYAQRRLEGLLSPLALNIGGAFTLQAIPQDPDGAMNAAANVSVSSGGVALARTLVTDLEPLEVTAYRATALAAATVTVLGQALAVAAGESVELSYPSALTAGGPILVDHAI